MFFNGSGGNVQSLQRAFHNYLLQSFGSFGQAVSEENIFLNRPISNKNCLWQPCLLTNQHDMSYFHRGLSTDVPTKFRFIWPSVSEEKIFFKLTNQKQELPVAAMFVYGSGRNVHSSQKAFHSYPLQNFGSFGEEVSGKIFQKLTNQKQELPVTVMFVNVSEENEHSLKKTFHRCFVPSVG